jgi:zinc transport system permease protein
MMGTYVVVRRISYIAGAIAHSVLGGIGISLYLQYHGGHAWFAPIYGAVLASLASAIVIGLVSMYARQREDTVIGAIWAVGMAIGVVFISKTPGYVDPMSYLFGNILMITSTDLWGILILDILVVGFGTLFYYKFQALCFDEEFSRLRGLRVTVYYLLLLCLISLSVVLLVMVVGIVMVIALLTIPAAVAGLFSRHLWQMMMISTLACMVFTIGGIGISYSYDLPAGATIILLAAVIYLLLIFVRFLRTRFIAGRSVKSS